MTVESIEKIVALPSTVEAFVRGGANAGSLVLLTHYNPSIGKWGYDWPNSSAIGHLPAKELLLPDGLRFKGSAVVPVKDRTQMQGGDPFLAISEGRKRTNHAILIMLATGRVLPAYPIKNEHGECWFLSLDPFVRAYEFSNDDHRIEDGQLLLHPDLVCAWQAWINSTPQN